MFPVDRVPVVEAATGVDRKVCVPDLFETTEKPTADDVAVARANEYALLGALLVRAPDAAFLRKLATLRGDPTPLGVHPTRRWRKPPARRASNASSASSSICSSGSAAASCCRTVPTSLTGFLHERPLARLRSDLAPLGIERVEGNCEPEDHIATLCEIMSGLASGRLPAPAGADQRIFEKHLAPWVGRFFVDLERAESAHFYRSVGALGRAFVDIETQAYALPA